MKTILLIDDDEDEFLIFSEVLQLLSLPLNCIYLSDGAAAQVWLRNNYADFIFLDMMMPKVNGVDLMQQLKTLPQTAKSTFVIFSTYINEPLCKKALEFGAKTCIQKPDTVVGLTNVMKSFFDQYEL
jgi:CheY-like chemotaxis protein